MCNVLGTSRIILRKRIHRVIEKLVRKRKKKVTILISVQYVDNKNAKKSGELVTKIMYEDFIDFKIVRDEIFLNMTKDTEGNVFRISEPIKFKKGEFFL